MNTPKTSPVVQKLVACTWCGYFIHPESTQFTFQDPVPSRGELTHHPECHAAYLAAGGDGCWVNGADLYIMTQGCSCQQGEHTLREGSECARVAVAVKAATGFVAEGFEPF